MIVSVGLVEDKFNIVPLKISGIDDNADVFDLAIIYTRSEVMDLFHLFRVDRKVVCLLRHFSHEKAHCP